MTRSAGRPHRRRETDESGEPSVLAVLTALHVRAQHQTEQLARLSKHLGQIDERLSALESGPTVSSDALTELRAELLEEAGDEEGVGVVTGVGTF